MITDRDVLDLCDEVESADFVDMRHVVVFNAIRSAQTKGDAINVQSVVSEIEIYALEHSSFGILEQVNEPFITKLIAKAPPGGLRTIRKDTQRLRNDRDFRESLYVINHAALVASRG